MARFTKILLASAIAMSSSQAFAVNIREFALSLGYQPLNPPQRVLDDKSNLWKPGTVLYLDKVKKAVFAVPACELLFAEPPKSIEVGFAATGAFEEDKKNAFSIALNLLSGLIEKISGSSLESKFDYSKHLVVTYTGLSGLTSTDENMREAVLGSSIDGVLSTKCVETLKSQKFNKGTDNQIKPRIPLFVISSSGIARGMKIELDGSARTEVKADIKITDVVNVKPSWATSRTTKESLEIEQLSLPIVWGYRPEPIQTLLRLGKVSADGLSDFKVAFGVGDGESGFTAEELSNASFLKE